MPENNKFLQILLESINENVKDLLVNQKTMTELQHKLDIRLGLLEQKFDTETETLNNNQDDFLERIEYIENLNPENMLARLDAIDDKPKKTNKRVRDVLWRLLGQILWFVIAYLLVFLTAGN